MARNKTIRILMIIPLLLWVLGCGKSAEPEARILFIGLDGLEMEVMKPLLANNELPHLKALIDRGVFGYLRTFEPTSSPVIWTSIATGKNPFKHKITGFVDVNSGGPYSSNARKGKALWNIAGDYGLKCNVTGYWITWPAERINGHMISQVSTERQMNAIWKGMLYKGVKDATYPPEFMEEIWPVVEPFQTSEFLVEEVYPRVYGDLTDLDPSYDIQKLLTQSNWSLAGDFMYCEAAKYLLENYPADLDIVYLGGTDVIAHRFWCFREPDIYNYTVPIAERYIETFKDTIDNYYRVADRFVGDLVARVPENTRIFILSDHGMHPDFLDGKDDGEKTLISAHHKDAPSGILIAAGDGIRDPEAPFDWDAIPELGTVFDVAPTVLYLLDIPVGRNMKGGKVMREVVTDELLQSRPVEHIDSHDIGFRPPTSSRSAGKGNREFIEKYRALGYIDGAGEDKSSSEFKMGRKRE